MIAHTSQFKDELFKFGRQYQNKIGVYENLLLATQNDDNIITENNDLIMAKVSNNDVSYEITDKNIFSIKLITKGDLLSTLMKELDFESDLNLDVGNIIAYQFGIKVNNSYEFLDYGKFVIYKKEYQNDKKTYMYTCYDFMLKTMIRIGNEFDFITTPDGGDILSKICDITGIDFDDSLTEQDGITPTPYAMIKNLSYPINVSLIKEAKITYRDLLNILCQYFGVSMYMDNNDLKIKLLGNIINDGGTWKVDNDNPVIVDTLDNTPFKDTNIVFKQQYGKINALNVSGTDESKIVYVEDTPSVNVNGITLFEVRDNLILNDDTIWNDYSTNIANNIFEMIDGVDFNLYETPTYGILYLQWLDYFNVTVNNRSYKCLLLNSEITIKDGISETIYTEIPESNTSEYTTTPKYDDVIGDTVRARGNAYANGSKLIQEDEILNKTYPIGSIFVADTNTNPSSILGGTWTLVDKEFKYKTVTHSDGVITRNTSNCTTANCWVTTVGHTIFIECKLTPSVSITDSTIELATLGLSTIGITSFEHNLYCCGYSDGGNAIIMFEIINATGKISSVGVVSRDGGSMPSGNTSVLEICTHASKDDMIDSHCDKFYWKRTN